MSKVRLYGSTSGFVELAAPAISDDGVLVLPTAAQGFGPAGIGSNVVQTVKTDTFSTTSTSYTVVTGLTATITPTTSTSRIMALLNISGSVTDTAGAGSASVRMTDGTVTSDVGDADGVRTRASVTLGRATGDNERFFEGSVTWLYVPGVTTPVTVSVEVLRGGTNGTVFIGRSQSNANTPANALVPAFLTLIEVAA